MPLFLQPAIRATDANGQPLPGALLYFYATGTLNPVDVYTTAALDVAHSNPVEADAGGLFPAVYTDPSVTHRAILKTADGELVQEVDPYDAPLSADAIIYNLGATGSHDRSLQDRLSDRVSVLDFIEDQDVRNAIRARSSTVNAAPYFQAAVDWLSDTFGGGTLYVPAGTYFLEGGIENANAVSWTGDGPNEGGSVLLVSAAFIGASGSPAAALRIASGLNGGTAQQIVIQGIAFGHQAGAATAGTTIGLYDTGTHGLVIRDCNFGGFKYGVVCDQTENAIIRDSYFHACKVGVWWVNGEEAELGNAGSLVAYNNHLTLDGGSMNSCTQWGVVIDGGEAHEVSRMNLNGPGAAIRACSSSNITIFRNYIEGIFGKSSIYFTNISYSGRTLSTCQSITFEENICSAPAGFGVIHTVTAGSLFIKGNCISGSGYLVFNASGAGSVVTEANTLGGVMAGVVDGRPSFYVVVGEGRRSISFAWNPASVAAGTQTSQTATVSGFGVDDFVTEVSFSASCQGGRMWGDFTNPNELTVYFRNPSDAAGAVDLPAGTVRVEIIASQV